MAASCGSRSRPAEAARSESSRADGAADAGAEADAGGCLAADCRSHGLSASTLEICRTMRGAEYDMGWGDDRIPPLVQKYSRLLRELDNTPTGAERARLLSESARVGLKLLCAEFKAYEQNCRLGHGMIARCFEREEGEVLRRCAELRQNFSTYPWQCPNH
jgi:hypothetical protein